MYTSTVSKDMRIKLPKTFKKMIEKGSRFIVSRSDDTIMLKQIRKPIWRAAGSTRTNNPMSLEQIDEIVHKVRRNIKRKRK